MPSSPLPPPLEPNFDLAAYRQFMCAETQLYREDYIRDRVQLQGQEHYQAALQKGSVVVVFVHHGSWLLMNGALHVYDVVLQAATVVVTQAGVHQGFVQLPHRWK